MAIVLTGSLMLFTGHRHVAATRTTRAALVLPSVKFEAKPSWKMAASVLHAVLRKSAANLPTSGKILLQNGGSLYVAK